ncbi:MAG: hypothetical protein AMXMBFR47_19760 [Planctomycetota bacterium]
MNCVNCGAVLRLVEGRGHFVCDYCAAVRPLDGPPAEGVDGLTAAATPTDAACPTCNQALHAAVLDGWSVSTCRACSGILVPRSAFGKIVAARRAAAAGPEITPRPIDPAEFSRTLRCPRCHERMEVHPYYGPGAVVIDSCNACGVVWLDRGELRAIEQAPGKR